MGETSIVMLPFTGGLDQKTAVEYLDPTQKQAAVLNGNFDKNGSVEKRLGMTALGNSVALPSTATIAKGARLTSWTRTPLMLFADSGAYAYDQAEGAFTQMPAYLPTIGAKRIAGVVASPGAQTAAHLCDFPFNGRTLRATVYADAITLRVYIVVVDADTNALHCPLTLVTGAGGTVRLAYYAASVGKVVIVTQDAGTLVGRSFTYTPSTNAIAGSTLIAPASGATTFIGQSDFSQVQNDSVNGGFLALVQTSATTLQWTYYSAALTAVIGPVTITTTNNAFSALVTCYGDSSTNTFYFGWSQGTGAGPSTWTTYVAAYQASLLYNPIYQVAVNSQTTSSAAPVYQYGFVPLNVNSTVMALITCALPSPTGVTGGNAGTTPDTLYPQMIAFTASTGAVTYLQPLPWGMAAVCKPFTLSGVAHWAAMFSPNYGSDSNLATTSTLDSSIFVFRLPTSLRTTGPFADLVATLAPRQVVVQTVINGRSSSGQNLSLPSPSALTGTRVAFSIYTLGQDIAPGYESANVGAQAWTCELTSTSQTLYQTAELNGELHIGGAMPLESDGVTFHEPSFIAYPEFAYASKTGTTTINTAYAIVYVHVDASGNVARSAPYQLAPVVSATSVTLYIPTLPVSVRIGGQQGGLLTGQTYAEIYKSVSGGSTLYYQTRVAADFTGQFGFAFTTYADANPGTAASTSSILYTTGGVLDSVIPPAGYCVIAHKNRVWRTDDTQRTIWFTRTGNPGEAAGYNEALQINCEDSGDITALASLDDKLVIFKASGIFIVYGDGPADTGQGSDLTVPQRLPSDVGALDWRSVVLANEGVYFRSAQGIYLLGRDLTVTYIGKAIEDSLAAYPTVVAAQLVASAQQVRFLCTNGTASVALVYDYLSQAWSVHAYAQVTSPVTSGCVVGNLAAMCSTNGLVWQESATSYLDQDPGGTTHFVPLSVTSAWVRTNGGALQGYQRTRRVLFMGHPLEVCGLSLSLAVNYDPTIVQTATFTSGFLMGQAQPQFATHVAGAWNKSQSIQVTVTDSAAGGATGQGCRFLGLAFELDNIGALNRRVPIQARQ